MDNFSFLDQQLVQLMLRICADQGCKPDKTERALLDQIVRQISTATREGTITIALKTLETDGDPEQLNQLLNKLPVVGAPDAYTPLIIEDGYLWLNRYWQYEQRLAANLYSRLRAVELSSSQTDNIQRTISEWWPEQSGQNSATPDTDWQQQAIALAVSNHFSIISGGPGTGKTTTITRLLWLLTSCADIKPMRILLAAPTGKAAMRLQESIRQVKSTLQIPPEQADNIPEQAVTLHRLLGYAPGKAGFRYNRQHHLPADVIIVDEASMIDIALMTRLAEAVPPQARLVLLGDKDQLAAVETGSVFRDLCSGADNQHTSPRQQQLAQLCCLPAALAKQNNAPAATPSAHDQADKTAPPLHDHIVVLQKSWRFKTDSGIGQLAATIRDGNEKALAALLQQDWPDVRWSEDSLLQTSALIQAWQEYFTLLKNSPRQTQPDTAWLHQVFNAFNRFRILTPLRQGPFGTEQLNQRLGQALLRQQQKTNGNWYNGRPVMVTRNDYRQQLFNGDIGLTLQDSRGELRVWFPQEDGFRAISPLRLPDHETAWVMTIHKSQGSEFDEVMLLLPDDEESRILGRELLYTGITRAKAGIELRGRLQVLQAALRRVTPPSSRIRQRISRY